MEVRSSPKFSETWKHQVESTWWSSFTLFFNSLFSVLKLWIVVLCFKGSGETFEIGALNLTGVDNIIICLFEIFFV